MRAAKRKGVIRALGVSAMLVIGFVLVVALGARARGALPASARSAAGGWASVSRAASGAIRGDLYAVVFDAGSTASRAHCFRFEPGGSQPELLHESFTHVKPGLSSYASQPTKAAQSLEPLLRNVRKCVPRSKKQFTPLEVKATAGLRSLPSEQSSAIVNVVQEHIRKTGFFKPTVSIIDGADEGSFQWVAVNYLLGRLRSGVEQQTTGVIDLGGESVQVAFELPPAAEDASTTTSSSGDNKSLQSSVEAQEEANAEEKYVRQLAGRRVYVSSWPALGMNAARARVANAASALGSSACFKPGDEGSFTRKGQEVEYQGSQQTASAKDCMKEARELLQLSNSCEVSDRSQCTLTGRWSGGASSVKIWHLSSFFFDAALEAGIVSKEKRDTGSAEADIASLRRAAEKECAGYGSEKGLSKTLCVDLTYAYTLLTEGLRLPETLSVTFLKEVSYRGSLIEAAWPLGSAVTRLLSER